MRACSQVCLGRRLGDVGRHRLPGERPPVGLDDDAHLSQRVRTARDGASGAAEFADHTDALTHDGEIRFRVPADVAIDQKFALQGDAGSYIRARIVAGGYGAEPGQAALLRDLSDYIG